jgi:1,3-beta-glucan synthase
MPRAPWKSILVGEIIGPICLAIVFVVCYLFVKSFAVGGVVEPGLLRIAIIALGPIVWNMAMLTLLFLISLFLGPCVSLLFHLSRATLISAQLVHQHLWCYHGCHGSLFRRHWYDCIL